MMKSSIISWVGVLVFAQSVVAESPEKHWSFQPIQKQTPPEVQNRTWVQNPIDRFVLAKLEEQGIAPSSRAERTTLLRRVTLDLTGLPPTPEEIDAFLNDDSPDAYLKVVDRLLASPAYGERWGRHWLDIARYADSHGFTIDGPRSIWKYRDWVINAINQDMPFDQFTTEQLAGDLLPNAGKEQLIATGFHRNTQINQEGGVDKEQFRVEAIIDRVNTTGTAWLGLSVGCAQCHDHKYDPIAQKEYYQLFAFFNSCDEPTLSLPTLRQTHIQKELGKIGRQIKQLQDSAKRLALVTGGLGTTFPFPELERKQAKLKKELGTVVSTMILRERKTPRDTHIHLGGDFLRKGEKVSPGTPEVLPSFPKVSNPTRLDLSQWLTDPDNPLTARVTVNRFWMRFFGVGIVETENDFGTQGTPPSHPALLDWLASEFIDSGWSMKGIHRLIVTSATYQQSSHHRPELKTIDPYNRLLSRQNRFRLDAEIIRDIGLASSGLLNRTIGGPSVYPPQPDGVYNFTQVNKNWKADTDADRFRRGMYTFFWRSAPHPALTAFDAPDATTTCTRRNRSNTPLQALTLLNDQGFFEYAHGLAQRILSESQGTIEERMHWAFRVCLGRSPTDTELTRLMGYYHQQLRDFRTIPAEARQVLDSVKAVRVTAGEDLADRAAWVMTARVLMNLDEFITRE